ncbi:M15 family metallopeptidase [Polluticaenibacter yanchengensis]|uniref:M15 family metallopeptidase n=1 Tax=Polluticaenibacter yanchengensis TaxID=3014562 RepID=A0ABT4UK19_9BACT|nr:M15 family metallopeptidase [Chitinophagaceae bacterium LY-5]
MIRRLILAGIIGLICVNGNTQTALKDTIVDCNYDFEFYQAWFKNYYSDSSDLNATQKKQVVQLIDSSIQLVNVVYYGYDKKIHKGQLLINKWHSKSIKAIFDELLAIRFPIHSVKPICFFEFKDEVSMAANNTSVFDYRPQVNSTKLSKHATGSAIDINPIQNPYISSKTTTPAMARVNEPTGRIRVSDDPGKKAIAIFAKYGWTWGGNWKTLKDYMHFQK